ncbi:MAG: hypothetical protein ACOC6F_03785, partial [bacterium]
RSVLERSRQPQFSARLLDPIHDLTRSQSELVLENALLRQQLIVLNCQSERPQRAASWRRPALSRVP